FKSLGMPILIGASRKTFIGKILNESEPGNRLTGTIASSVAASLNGANILRVHDVKAVKEALKVTDRIKL
ncbi:MAG TPA: dihydropteroate synthase, partial [Candidatus Omnitrophota bacterium]|nr:dihydropteroate synthase [Candidatus Omnitrophota bacterium]